MPDFIEIVLEIFKHVPQAVSVIFTVLVAFSYYLIFKWYSVYVKRRSRPDAFRRSEPRSTASPPQSDIIRTPTTKYNHYHTRGEKNRIFSLLKGIVTLFLLVTVVPLAAIVYISALVLIRLLWFIFMVSVPLGSTVKLVRWSADKLVDTQGEINNDMARRALLRILASALLWVGLVWMLNRPDYEPLSIIIGAAIGILSSLGEP